jgi:hypothetical protein
MSGALSEIWNNTKISLQSKLRLLDSCMSPTLLNACKTWTLKMKTEEGLHKKWNAIEEGFVLDGQRNEQMTA